MILTSLGRIAVPVPGTPLILSTDVTKRVARVILQAAPANTGRTYFGAAGMNKTTLAGVSRILSATENYEVATEDNTDGISLSRLAIDADVAGEGLLVSYWIE